MRFLSFRIRMVVVNFQSKFHCGIYFGNSLNCFCLGENITGRLTNSNPSVIIYGRRNCVGDGREGMYEQMVYSQRPSYKSDMNRIGWCLTIMVCMFQLTSPLWYGLGEAVSPFFSYAGMYCINTLCETLFYMSCFIVPAVLFYPMSRKKSQEPVRLSIRLPGTFPLMIMGGMAVILAASYVNDWMMQMIGYDLPGDTVAVDGPYAVYLYITVALAPAFCEELLFRGVVYGNLRRYGVPLAVLVSALLFSLMHQNIGQTFYTFAAGVVLALCYEATGSLWCGIFLHMFNNLFSAMEQVLAGAWGVQAYPILNLLDAAVMLAGIVSILILLARYRTYRKNRQVKDQKDCDSLYDQGLYGHTAPLLLICEKPDTGTAVRQFFAPGMIVFVVLDLLCTLITALYVYGVIAL